MSIMLGLYACNPKISTSLSKNYPPTDYKQDILILGLNDEIPINSEDLGEIKIGDGGFTTNCGYDVVIEAAKLEARKAGGNAIKITEHKLPSALGSSCHRIKARVLKISDTSLLSQNDSNQTRFEGDYAILNVYRYSGMGTFVGYDLYLGDSAICRVSNKFKTSIKITKDGLNSLWAKTEAKVEVPINVKFGMEYYLRCGISMGAFVGRPKLELVDSKTGKQEFESFRPKDK